MQEMEKRTKQLHSNKAWSNSMMENLHPILGLNFPETPARPPLSPHPEIDKQIDTHFSEISKKALRKRISCCSQYRSIQYSARPHTRPLGRPSVWKPKQVIEGC